MDNRGGKCLKTGKIGRLNCLRQQLVRPGETLDMTIDGDVLLESLRERESVGINVQIHTFFTPLRWVDSNWVTFLREGPETGTTITKTTGDMVALGIGSDDGTGAVANSYPEYFKNNYLRIYNEFYKWPEDADASSVDTDGNVLVPLATAWSRARDSALPDNTADYTVSSGTDFTVQALAEVQGRFRAAMEREVLSWERYTDMLQKMFGVSGSGKEEDQVPILIDSTEAGVSPRDMPATDGASLGTYMGIYDFTVQHRVGSFSAPEHGIICYMMAIRFNSVADTDGNPFAQLVAGDVPWAEHVGDNEILGSMDPELVDRRYVVNAGTSGNLGYLPAGWRWRYGWNLVGTRIDNRDTFPIYDGSSYGHFRDATSVHSAFRSTSLGDYRVNLNFKEQSYSGMPGALSSYYVGEKGKKDGREFITPGVN